MGKCQLTKESIARGLALSRAKFVLSAAALTLACCNEAGQAQSLIDELQKRFPKDTPVNLIANLEPDFGQLVVLQAKIAKALLKIHTMNLSSKQATAELIKSVPELIAANKCPDFVEDKGHYFGTDLPEDDKRALIEYLKTF